MLPGERKTNHAIAPQTYAYGSLPPYSYTNLNYLNLSVAASRTARGDSGLVAAASQAPNSCLNDFILTSLIFLHHNGPNQSKHWMLGKYSPNYLPNSPLFYWVR